MRHYDRVSYRHLNDSERYRDYDYLADDAWIGANERVPHGVTDANEPPWSTLGGYETGALLDERTFDARRGQGRDYGRDLGLGYGREHDVRPSFDRDREQDPSDGFDRGRARPRALTHRLEYPRDGFAIAARPSFAPPNARGERTGGSSRRPDVREALRHPGAFVRSVVRGIFRGRGPKDWQRSDVRIRDEVCELLARHSHVDATDIEVSVEDGEVTLSGSVADRRTKRLAEEALDDVLGVKDVHNRLKVG